MKITQVDPTLPHSNTYNIELTFGKLLAIKHSLDKLKSIEKLSVLHEEILLEINLFLQFKKS